jgi:CheY-like chemotaxis protein
MPPHREVLIVEDDVSTRELLAAIVQRHSCRGVQCGDGRSAEALLQLHAFDAILLDLLLPELSGMEILALLALHQPQNLPRVVVITAAAPALWQDCPEIKQVQVIRKPFDIEDVDAALTRCWT